MSDAAARERINGVGFDRVASIAVVVLLHLFAFWVIAGIRPTFESAARSRELDVSVFNPQTTPHAPAPPIAWLFQAPEDTAPDVPYDLRAAAVGAVIMLHLLILPDGSVYDAQILQSSHSPDLDRITLDFVKKNWRFLPPSMGGKPIEAWTTAFVRFSTPSKW